jgi:hypothetical protein
MRTDHAVSVIIPTTGLPERKDLLWRAVKSVLGQRGVRAVPIVVLNGPLAEPELEEALRNDPGIRLVRQEEASLPASLKEGRSRVDTEWFAELDDDDLLVPGALLTRLEALLEDPSCDVVVTNGFRRGETGDTLHVADMGAVEKDPVGALSRGNWLLPGAWLCRTGRVGDWVFEQVPPFRECTYLAYVFAVFFKTRFLPEPTVVWHTATPSSASSTKEYMAAGPEAVLRIMELDLPSDLQEVLRRRMGVELHSAAEWHRSEGNMRDAWKAHLASLRWPGGLRYTRFSGRLLLSHFSSLFDS